MPIIFKQGGAMAYPDNMAKLGFALETLTTPGFPPSVSEENPFPKKAPAWQYAEEYMLRIASTVARDKLPDCTDLDIIDDLRLQFQQNVLRGMKQGHRFVVEALQEGQ